MTTMPPDAVDVMIADLVGKRSSRMDGLVAVAEQLAIYLGVLGYTEGELLTAIAAVRPWCRLCGCTDEFACDGGCSWVAADVCSSHPSVAA